MLTLQWDSIPNIRSSMDLTTWPGYVPGFSQDHNLRELGGLPTTDGRHVRRGLLFRGSALTELDDVERVRLDELGLRFVLDLRAKGEAAGNPERVPEGAEYLRLGGMRYEDGSEVDFSPEGIERFQREAGLDGPFKLADDFFSRLYISMLFDNPATHALWERFEQHVAPLFFHCTAGKDRTGMSAVVLELALGVTREAMLEDFMITNQYREFVIERAVASLSDGSPAAEEHVRKAYGVQIENVQSALAAVDERFPSPEAYVQAEYGVSPDELAALRDFYLE